MGKGDQPSTGARRKPLFSSNDLPASGKRDGSELADNELSEVAGGSDMTIPKSTDKGSTN